MWLVVVIVDGKVVSSIVIFLLGLVNGNLLIFGRSYEVDKGELGIYFEYEENEIERLGFFFIIRDCRRRLDFRRY